MEGRADAVAHSRSLIEKGDRRRPAVENHQADPGRQAALKIRIAGCLDRRFTRDPSLGRGIIPRQLGRQAQKLVDVVHPATGYLHEINQMKSVSFIRLRSVNVPLQQSNRALQTAWRLRIWPEAHNNQPDLKWTAEFSMTSLFG
ncbi:hypothetical protein [Hoeflea sp.]|uniref:hypothetical protein n=1 Tax=Hoeflea sp. TaxID=1940281 RepID=UPI003A93E54E